MHLKKNVDAFLAALKKRNMSLNNDKTISYVTELAILGYCVGHGTIKPDPERLKVLLELPPPTHRNLCKGPSVYLHTTQSGYRISLTRSSCLKTLNIFR